VEKRDSSEYLKPKYFQCEASNFLTVFWIKFSIHFIFPGQKLFVLSRRICFTPLKKENFHTVVIPSNLDFSNKLFGKFLKDVEVFFHSFSKQNFSQKVILKKFKELMNFRLQNFASS